MTMNYYLAWLHFDTHGRMMTRLPDGHRVLHVLADSGSNRHPPALWVLVEAVVATPSFTPAAGFPAAGEMPVEYRQPPMPPGPVPSRNEQFDFHDHAEAGMPGPYPELAPERRDAQDDDYRVVTNSFYNPGNHVSGVPMSPARS